ncbi:MAG: hypothetical protein HQL12_02375 [Candidatus Omnitrophica bacterium]|nr:hypothetical protein [Candidatus Omnitrophota bacterium]
MIDVIVRVIILIIGVGAIAFCALLYNFYEKQKSETDLISKQQQLAQQANSDQFKRQQDQIERLSKDLEISQHQINDQKDALADQKSALLQEAEKRQQIENESKSIQTALVDIKAEADAIKQDVKGWQKDYVAVLVQLEKKMDTSRAETKNLEDSLASLNIPELKQNINFLRIEIEKIAHSLDNTFSSTPPVFDKQTDRSQMK